jgi:hypothetical protein
MKRIVWIVLLAFCSALAQVQPAQPVTQIQEKCGCCEDGANACGMPDCATVPTAPATATAAFSPSVALRAEADSVLPKSRSLRNHFFAQFVPSPAVPAELAPLTAAPVASVPVFKAHCSFLI